MNNRLAPFLVLAAIGIVGLVACPNNTNNNNNGKKDSGNSGDGGNPGDGGNNGGDAGPDAGKPPCLSDNDCPNQVCQVDAGICQPALKCDPSQGPNDCNFQKAYCDPAGGEPICVCNGLTGAIDGGVCVHRLGLCDPCDSSPSCGDDTGWWADSARDCVTYNGASTCLQPIPGAPRQCPGGYVKANQDGGPQGPANYCLPQGGSCGAGPCTSDDQCNLGYVCDLARQLCVAACNFDYETHDTLGCPTGQVCHVLDRYLKPNVPPQYFGMGKCGKPCDQAGVDCSKYSSLDSCATEPVSTTHGGNEHRCRPPSPKCINDKDPWCGAAPPYKGYCDTPTMTCVSNKCRTDVDCASGFGCTPLTNTCDPLGCVKGGGARVYCGDPISQCCGEPIAQSDGGFYKNACTTGVDAGQCFPAENPPWCATCSVDPDCNMAGNPGRIAGDTNWCLQYKQGVFGCFYSCWTPQDCPTSMPCIPLGYVQCKEGVGSECNDPKSCQNTGLKDQPDGSFIFHCACGDQKPPDGGAIGTYTCPQSPDFGVPTRCDDYGRWCIVGTYCNPAHCP
jgi:hypothetical protein